MSRWTDEPLDRELRSYLDWQAEQTAGAPSSAEIAARMAQRLEGSRGSHAWRSRATLLVAVLALLLALALGAALSIGAWRPVLFPDGLPDGPIAVVPSTPDPAATAEPVPSPLEPIASASASDPLTSAVPSGSPARPSPSPSPTDPTAPSATPVAPTPDPAVELLVNGSSDGAFLITAGDSVDVDLRLVTQDLDASRCTLTHRVEPDKPEVSGSNVRLSPVPSQTVALIDGWHTFAASCPSSNGVLETQIRVLGFDRQPERCRDFAFPESAITISTLAELEAGIVGSWEGCVTTPWVATYFVTMTFRDDGTYSAASTEVLDAQRMIAMYYGTDDDSTSKRYAINDLQASRKGVGQIDVFFGPGNVSRGDLRNIRLMGDALEFEFFHRSQYGPLTFRLMRPSS
jgi:hypothetical protein